MKAFSDGVIMVEFAARQRFADERGERRGGFIVFVEEASAAQRDTHGLTKLRTDPIAKDITHSVRAVLLKLHRGLTKKGRIITERQGNAESRLPDRGNASHGLNRPLKELQSRRKGGARVLRDRQILRPRGVHHHREQVIGVEAWIDSQ